MYAAQVFNAARGAAPSAVFGAVTTGSSGMFLRLDGAKATIDLTERYLHEVERIVGILVAMTSGALG